MDAGEGRWSVDGSGTCSPAPGMEQVLFPSTVSESFGGIQEIKNPQGIWELSSWMGVEFQAQTSIMVWDDEGTKRFFSHAWMERQDRDDLLARMGDK